MGVLKRWRAFLAFELIVVVVGGSAQKDETHNLTELTQTTFDGHLENVAKQDRLCLVMFHVNWCKVCQKTFPKFAAAAELVAEKQVSMDFAHVDCTEDKSLCQRFHVQGYPSIKLFSPETAAKEQLTYKGPRTEQQFLSFAERMTLPEVRYFADNLQLEAALQNEQYSAFLSVGTSVGSGGEGLAAGEVKVVASKWRDRHIFGVSPRLEDVLPEGALLSLQDTSQATLVALSPGVQQWPGADNSSKARPAATSYTGSLQDVEALEAWVNASRFPGIWKVTESNFYELTHAHKQVVMVAMDPADVTLDQEVQLRKVADRFKSRYIFGVVDGVEWTKELSDLNIFRHELPRIFVTEDNFNSWVEDIENLRLDSLEADLEALESGAPLLRQDRGPLSRLLVYWREAMRFKRRTQSYAGQGQMQTLIVGGCCCGFLLLVFLLGRGSQMCCSYVFADDDMASFAAQVDKKRA